jgi:hypothetical protein
MDARKTIILDILHSIKDFNVEDDQFDVVFNEGEVLGTQEFVPGSFTRELLELIERHLA